jgi:hypothetical protein
MSENPSTLSSPPPTRLLTSVSRASDDDDDTGSGAASVPNRKAYQRSRSRSGGTLTRRSHLPPAKASHLDSCSLRSQNRERESRSHASSGSSAGGHDGRSGCVDVTKGLMLKEGRV